MKQLTPSLSFAYHNSLPDAPIAWANYDSGGNDYRTRANHDRAGSGYEGGNDYRTRANHDGGAGGIDNTADSSKYVQDTNAGKGNCEEPRPNKGKVFHRET